MTDHPRESWMLRRKADWTLLCTIIGMVATVIFYSVRAVQAHARWMDRVTTTGTGGTAKFTGTGGTVTIR